jgi:glycosyltransferase involved in cell wall biosynthesis
MLNLPAFLALVRPLLGRVPVALYCHENQLTYPLRPGERRDLAYGVINWLSMLVADHVFFNSAYHLEEWFDELPRLLKHFPDYTHLGCVTEVRSKASVLPVGCDLDRLDAVRTGARESDVPLVLWNQRWEYDKAPEVFFRALDAAAEEGLEFEVALAGTNVRQKADEFEAARERLGKRVVHYGWADAATYARLLWQADVVVSTAIHEFFGISVVEAIYCGCFPILPRRLAYPEVVPLTHHECCLYEGLGGLVERLRWALTHLAQARQHARELRSAVGAYGWNVMVPKYDAALRDLRSRAALDDLSADSSR